MVVINCFIQIPGIQNMLGFRGINSFDLHEQNYHVGVMSCIINAAYGFFFSELSRELCIEF